MREETGQKGPWQHSERVAWWRNPNRPLARAGATRRADRYADDPDEQLLESRGATDWVHTDPWRVLRIQSEFVEGFGALAELGPAIAVFGSARTHRDDPFYEKGVRIGGKLVEAGYAVITGGGPGAMEAANKGAAEADGVSV